MKWYAYTLVFFIVSSFGFQNNPQTWTDIERETANTAATASYLSTTEKQIIYYLNLARLYPKKFALLEVKDYYLNNNLTDSKYKKSLLKELNNMEPLNALQPKEALYINAKCLQLEQGKSGEMGHKRKRCEKKNYAECCAYGSPTAREVVVDLLIDLNIPNLGHRKVCLHPSFKNIGVSHGKHKKHGVSTVIEFQ